MGVMVLRKQAALAALLAGMMLVSAGPLRAEDTPPGPTQKLEEGVENFLSAIKLFLLAIPQYSAPEVLPNGDIIIRRIHPGEEPETEKKDEEADSHKI